MVRFRPSALAHCLGKLSGNRFGHRESRGSRQSGWNAIGFRLGHMQPLLNGKADLLYTYETNEYNGRTNYQLNLKDVKAVG